MCIKFVEGEGTTCQAAHLAELLVSAKQVQGWISGVCIKFVERKGMTNLAAQLFAICVSALSSLVHIAGGKSQTVVLPGADDCTYLKRSARLVRGCGGPVRWISCAASAWVEKVVRKHVALLSRL